MTQRPDSPGERGLSRRDVLAYGAVGIAAAALAAAAPALAAQSNAVRDLETFSTMSQALTGKQTLNAITSERIFLALGGYDRTFMAALQGLAAKLDQPPSSWSDADRELAGRIIRAWYLGKVGEGSDADVITYEHALMFEAVSDALKPRTFCASQPGLWASKPA
jgi:hypothetical protein